MPKYDVLRQHDGDRQYFQGDTRELAASDAMHLVRLGTLAPAGEVKAAPTLINKSDKPLSNKAPKGAKSEA
ncbi:hypothetical protein V5F77_20440 [Xanthobacter sp. DSM 24535]|uniref:hypothetical protein n=1 Tax=Roseixanthobacter psychrophilus TaxID=3119917 RepID=UPI00372C5980